ncbi:MAG: NACHT domain protein [Chloroflexi bacterium ADurb.Bin360]|nr:MAG: NACHT domain protein [Chloroflexi bacterium ADurb.Bin360]
MIGESEYITALFADQVYYEEAPLIDRKETCEWSQAWAKTEFIRDIISLANTARLRGKPAYLLLGINDKGNRCGIDSLMRHMNIAEGAENFAVSEAIKGEFQKRISAHIQPTLLHWDFYIVEIDNQRCGCLVIEPTTPSALYHVKKAMSAWKDGKDKSIYQGEAWIRSGESKVALDSISILTNDPEYQYSYSEVPYVLPSIWQRYFEQVQGEILRYWNRAEPPAEAAYQELHDSKGVTIQKAVEDFFREEDRHLLVLQGAAGSGKSLFLQRLVRSLAQEGAQDMDYARQLEQYRPPSGLIPILLPLRNLTRQSRTDSLHFAKQICNLLHVLWDNNERGGVPKSPQKLFENSHLQWLILLDGLDEVGKHEYRCEFLNVLLEFMSAYPRLHVILTSRPVISLEDLENARLVDIAPLDETQIEAFFTAQRTDRNDAEIHTFIQRCKDWQDAWKLLSVPAYLNAAITALDIPRDISDIREQVLESSEPNPDSRILTSPEIGNRLLPIIDSDDLTFEVESPVTQENVERLVNSVQEIVITLPRLLDRVYEAFWERERRRGRFSSIEELRFGTYRVATNLMADCSAHVEREKAKRYLKAKGLQWALEMGILDDNEFNHIFFATPSTQVYSATKKLECDIEGGFEVSIRQYVRRWRETYRTEIESFFEDLTGSSLSIHLETQGGSNG